MIDWEQRYRELENQIEQMLIKFASSLRAAEDGASVRAVDSSGNKVREIIVDSKPNPKLVTVVADGVDLEYALYLYGDSDTPTKYAYQRNNTFSLGTGDQPFRRMKAFARTRSDKDRLGVKHFDLTK